ncbi:MAG: hypothetical protein NT007_10140 [Candidatus Kapabacteria bacterium]|nr:hypothetical protein [Candidatus Kapabacteria bacterium]
MQILLISCSQLSNYKVLSFVFDGVPDPKNEKHAIYDSLKRNDNLTDLKAETNTKVKHKPFEDKRCNTCHQIANTSLLKDNQPQLCYQCHPDNEKKYKFTHAPVISGYCTKCHSPHLSENKKLIISDNQTLCYQCHDKADVNSYQVHIKNEDKKCWSCHNPHGGKDMTFQK